MKEFTADNLTRLKELFTNLCFAGEFIEGKFGANQLNPFDLLNSTAIPTLRMLLVQTRKAKQEMEELDEWSMNTSQTAKKSRLEVWADFINLTIGYRLDQEAKAATRAEKMKKARELDARIAAETDKGKTLDDLKKEREALGV